MKRHKQYVTVLSVVLIVAGIALTASAVAAEGSQQNIEANATVVEGESIQDAINAADPGDTITIQEGTYEERLTIDKPLTLVADGDVVLDGNNVGDGSGITVTASDVTIEGIEIRRFSNDGIEIIEDDALSRSVTIDGVTSRLNGGSGLYIEATTDTAELTIVNSRFIDNGDTGVFGSGEFDSVNISETEVSENADGGVNIETVEANVEGSTIADNAGGFGDIYGLYIQNAEVVTLSDTVVLRSEDTNIRIDGTAPLTRSVRVENVSTRSAGGDGITVVGTSDSSELIINDSRISSNNFDGVEIINEIDNFEVYNTEIDSNGNNGLEITAVTVGIDSVEVTENGNSRDQGGIILNDAETANITNSTVLSSYDDNIRITGTTPLTRSVTITNVSSRLAGGDGLDVSPTDDQSELAISESEFSGNNIDGIRVASEFDITNVSDTVVTANGADGVELRSQSVYITNVEVTENGDFSDDNGILVVNGQDTRIENSTVTGNYDSNIFIDGEPVTRSITITNVTASQSQTGDGITAVGTPEEDSIDLINVSAVGNGGDGVDAGVAIVSIDRTTLDGNGGDGAVLTSEQLTFAQSSAVGNGDDGIDGDITVVDISESTLDENVDHGLLLTSDELTFSQSSAAGNGEDGIDGDVAVINVEESTLDGNGGDGVILTSDQLTFAQSSAVGNGDDGIDASVGVVNIDRATLDANEDIGLALDSSEVTISRSSVANNTDIGILFAGLETGADISQSTILGNGNFEIENQQDGITVDAQNNWWGDSGGPADGAVVGDVNVANPLAGPPGVDTAITRGSITVEPNETTTAEVQFTSAENGVSAYQFNLSIEDASVVNISEVTVTNDPEFVDVNVTDDGSAATVNVGMGNSSFDVADPVVTEVTLTAGELGETNIAVSDVTVTDVDNEQYIPGETSGATVTVSEDVGPPSVTGDNRPKDPDGDGLYEDVDGSGNVDIFDVQALFDNLDSNAVQNNPRAFNFDGRSGVDIFDIQELFSQL